MNAEPAAAASGYSLVMTGFQGDSIEFHEVAKATFGRQGLDSWALCSRSRRERTLPAKIASQLSSEEAERIAEALRAAGAELEILPSASVTDVLFRTAECWPTRSVRDAHFTEVEGMVLSLPPISARRSVLSARENHPNSQPWMIEQFANHQHPTTDFSRHALRMAREAGEEVETALRIAYPEREFVLSYRNEQYSFYQRGNGAPEVAPAAIPAYDQETAHCETCNTRRRFQRIEEPDPEFPNALWGICCECGAELLLEANEVLVIIEASEAGRHQP